MNVHVLGCVRVTVVVDISWCVRVTVVVEISWGVRVNVVVDISWCGARAGGSRTCRSES